MDAIENKVSLIDWFDEHMNPMAVRYFRQAVQNKTLFVMFIMLLAIQVGAALIISMNSDGLRAGQSLFIGVVVCWVIMACLAVPAYMSQRVAADRGDKLDMTSITTMSPFKYVNGIIVVGLGILLLMASVCLPFLAFSYIMRGIGLVEIFTAVGGITLSSLSMLLLGIMSGTFPNKKGKSSGAAFIVLMIIVGSNIMRFAFSFIPGTTLFSSSAGYADFTVLGLVSALLPIGLFYLIAVHKVSPEMSNRMMPLRIYMSAAIVTIFAALYFVVGLNSEATLAACWVTVWLIICSLLVAVSEQDEVSLRVRTQIPRTGLLRFLAWFFYSGSAAGICWCVVSFLLIMFVLFFSGRLTSSYVSAGGYTSLSYSDISRGMESILVTGLYAYCFCMTSLFIRRYSARETVKPAKTAIIIIFLLLIVHIVIHTLAVFARPEQYANGLWSVFNGSNLPWWVALDPVACCITDERSIFMATAWPVLMLWAGVITLAMIPWFGSQIKSFSPIEREEIMVLEK